MKPPGIAAGTFIQLALKVAGLFMGLGVAALMARGLGREGFGLASIGLTIVGLAGVLVDAGISQAATREMSLFGAKRDQLAGAVVLVRFVMGALFALLSTAVFAFFVDGPILAFAVLVLSLPLGAAIGLSSAMNASLRPDWVGYTSLLQSLSWTAAVVICAGLNLPLEWWAAGFTMATSVQALVSWCLVRRVHPIVFRGSRAHALAMLSWSWHLSTSSLFAGLLQRLPMFVLQSRAGASETALFGGAWRLFDSANTVMMAVNAVLVPLYASRVEHRQRLLILFITAGATFSLAFFAILGPVGESFGRFLLGSEFYGIGLPLQVALVVFVFYSFDLVMSAVSIVEGRTKLLPKLGLLGAFVSLVSAFVLVPAFSTVGACVAVLIGQAVRTLGLLAATPEVRNKPLMVIVLKLLTVTACTYGLVAATAASFTWVFGAVVGVTVFAAGALLLRVINVRETWVLLRR